MSATARLRRQARSWWRSEADADEVAPVRSDPRFCAVALNVFELAEAAELTVEVRTISGLDLIGVCSHDPESPEVLNIDGAALHPDEIAEIRLHAPALELWPR